MPTSSIVVEMALRLLQLHPAHRHSIDNSDEGSSFGCDDDGVEHVLELLREQARSLVSVLAPPEVLGVRLVGREARELHFHGRLRSFAITSLASTTCPARI